LAIVEPAGMAPGAGSGLAGREDASQPDTGGAGLADMVVTPFGSGTAAGAALALSTGVEADPQALTSASRLAAVAASKGRRLAAVTE
jgi:hypothetical protein